MTDPSFRQLWQAGRAHMASAPAIGEINPDDIVLLDGPARRGQRDALAIGEVNPDALEVRNSRQRQALRDLIASKDASNLGYNSYLDDYQNSHPARPDKPVSQMTLAEVYAYQDRLAGQKKYDPVGRYQIRKPTLR